MPVDQFCVGVCYGICVTITEGAGLIACYAGCEIACAALEPQAKNRFRLKVQDEKTPA